MEQVQIGIIGGSGLYDMAEVTDRKEVTLSTPFGDPSGPYVIGTLRGRRVAFLARHGAGHRLSPSELNFRANIFGMKRLGVEYILSASAVGSLKQEYKPLDIVIPDQFIDRTRGRVSTFFGRGLVAHIAFATSFDEVVVTLFLAGPEQATLPRQMFSGIRENLSPTIAAAATLLIAFSVILLLTLEWLRGRSEKLRTAQV